MRRLHPACALLIGIAACDGSSHLAGDLDGSDGVEGRDVADVADGRDDGDAVGADDADAAGDVGDGADIDPCGPGICANDPPAGPVGRACVRDDDCGRAGMYCLREDMDFYEGTAYVNFAGGYCTVIGYGDDVCEPRVPGSCPEGSTCISFGRGRTGMASSGCLDMCAASDSTGVPWETNCDCRDGYQCSLVGEICLPGCTHDLQCCEIWQDRNRDGGRDPGEITRLPPTECADTCDPCRYTCVRHGCPGGDCAVGDPCRHDADCPPLGSCIDEWSTEGAFPGGMCSQDRCDLVGRECPGGSGCGNLGGVFYAYRVCVLPCEAGTAPGDPGFVCRDLDPPGPSAGDYACRPADERFWFDGSDDTGYCWAGNFPGGDESYGSPCREDDECASPQGVGFCLELPGAPGFCSAACNEATAAAGGCEIDPAAADVSGYCLFGFCVEACDAPGAPPGTNGCTDPHAACSPAIGYRAFSAVAEGKDLPPGYCWPACLEDTWCRDLWSDDYATCDVASGVCIR